MSAVSVSTASGSEYLFDNEAMTWRRRNTNPGHEEILFMPGVSDGRLAAPVEPKVGHRLTFFTDDHDWVTTTPVVTVE